MKTSEADDSLTVATACMLRFEIMIVVRRELLDLSF
jgi:hypothetical protein